nr:immunoglobulin heavy chain junction region [Mus musculus]
CARDYGSSYFDYW